MTLSAQTIATEALQISQRAGYAAKELPAGALGWTLDQFESFLREVIAELDMQKHRSTHLPYAVHTEQAKANAKNCEVEVELIDTPTGEKWMGLQITVAIEPELREDKTAVVAKNIEKGLKHG